MTICLCGENQTEKHILLECEERVVQTTSIHELFNQQDQRSAMKSIFESLLKFEKVRGSQEGYVQGCYCDGMLVVTGADTR